MKLGRQDFCHPLKQCLLCVFALTLSAVLICAVCFTNRVHRSPVVPVCLSMYSEVYVLYYIDFVVTCGSAV